MASNGPGRGHSYRDSYVAKEIQGHLEKKKGVLGSKTRLWCSVQESTLCMQKKQGEPLQTIDLKDSHLVRKVTSDVTGTNFEICMKKKTHVFICPTSEDCTAWVRCLQAAMALKDYGQIVPDQETDTSEETNIYHSPDDECSPQVASNDQAALKQEYTEVFDAQSNCDSQNLYYEIENIHVSPPDTQQRKERISRRESAVDAAAVSSTETNPETIYSDAISETAKTAAKSPADSTEETVRTAPPLSQRAPPPPRRALSTRLISVSIDPTSPKPSSDANPAVSGGISNRQSIDPTSPKPSSDANPAVSGGISNRQSIDPTSSKPSSNANLTASGGISNKQIIDPTCPKPSPDANPTASGGISNRQIIDPTCPKPSPGANPTASGGISLRRPSHDRASLQPSLAASSPDSGLIPQIDQSSDEEDNHFGILEEALTSDNSPIPDFIHPLTDKDWTPINDLSHFLRSNVELCRVSSSIEPTTEDPVNVLKSYLKIASIKTAQS